MRHSFTGSGAGEALLALLWAVSLAVALLSSRLEVFLLFAPLSAAIYLLVPPRGRKNPAHPVHYRSDPHTADTGPVRLE